MKIVDLYQIVSVTRMVRWGECFKCRTVHKNKPSKYSSSDQCGGAGPKRMIYITHLTAYIKEYPYKGCRDL